MRKPKAKRQPIYSVPLPARPKDPYYGYGRTDAFGTADHMRHRLLSEADLLTAMGDSRGERFRSLILELPWSSFTRI